MLLPEAPLPQTSPQNGAVSSQVTPMARNLADEQAAVLEDLRAMSARLQTMAG